MVSTIQEFAHARSAHRPTQDLDGFVLLLRRGFNFSAANTSAWTLEDWELAVDAIDDEDGCGVAPPIGTEIFAPEPGAHGESRYEQHGIWTLLALAYLRGRGAFRAGVSKTARPFRTIQIKEANVPPGLGEAIDMQFRNGFDDALADAVAGGDRTPDWVRLGLRGPLLNSQAAKTDPP